MSLRLHLLSTYLRKVEKPALARISEPAVARARFERQSNLFRDPPFSLYLQDELASVDVTWASSRSNNSKVILYFHGGGYVMGSAATHRAMLARLSAMTGMRACLPDYRLSPEHPYPGALDDGWAVWQELLRRGYSAQNIILGGDSAGGGLALSLLARICRNDSARPACAFAFSPWTDLTMAGESLISNAKTEAVLPIEIFPETRDRFLGDADPLKASPLWAKFPDCPPVFLQASHSETLRDDCLAMAQELRGQSVDVTLDMWDDTPHVWTLFQGWIPEADKALARVAAFIAQRFPSSQQGEN